MVILRHCSCLFLLILAGCTVGPNYHAPNETLPSHYTTTAKTQSKQALNMFWHNFSNDPMLESLIQQAVRGCNLDVQKAAAKVREARAALGISHADLLPQLNASAAISRDHLSRNGELLGSVPFTLPQNYTDYKAGFDASWEIDFFGHTRRSIEGANARLQGAVLNQYNVEIMTAAEVASDYIQYRVDQKRIEIAKRNIAAYEDTAKLVKLQLHAGSATSVDTNRIESEVESAQAALPALQADARATLAALAVLVGEYPETLFAKLNSKTAIPQIKANNLSLGLPSDLLQRRPDVMLAERNLAAATADIGVAVANQFPRFQLVGDIGFDTIFPGTYANAASRYWNWGPQISVPIFQGGRLKYAVRQREAARDEVLAIYKQSILQALADVESSLIRYDRERIRKQKLRVAYEKIQAAAKLVKLQYRDGQIALTDVLDVERQVYQLNDQYVQSVGLEAVNLVALYKALGGGWVVE